MTKEGKKMTDITDFTVDGECSRCGACCADLLPLSTAEIKRLQRWVKKHNFRPKKRSVGPAEGLILDATCPFMVTEDGKAACAIYDERPEICRVFRCDRARSGEIPSMSTRRYRVVSVRREIFHDEAAMTLQEHIQLLAYIKERNKEE